MRILKYLFVVAIFLLTVDKVVNYMHVEILKDGGYTGLFCLKHEYVQDEVFKCVKSNSKCTGIGKLYWYDPKVPLDMNYYNGTIYSCNVPCNYERYIYNERFIKIHGSRESFYILIKKTLSVINASNYVKNGEIFSANIKNLNLIDPPNVTLKFDNPLFKYTNLSINKNELKCTLQVNDDKVYNTKFISKVYLLYGNYNCTKSLFLGYVFLVKEYFDVEKYIETLKNEKLKLQLETKKLKKEHGLEIQNLKKGLEIESFRNNLNFYLNKTNEEKPYLKNTIFKSNTSAIIIIVLAVVFQIVAIVLFIFHVRSKRRKKYFKKRWNYDRILFTSPETRNYDNMSITPLTLNETEDNDEIHEGIEETLNETEDNDKIHEGIKEN